MIKPGSFIWLETLPRCHLNVDLRLDCIDTYTEYRGVDLYNGHKINVICLFKNEGSTCCTRRRPIHGAVFNTV